MKGVTQLGGLLSVAIGLTIEEAIFGIVIDPRQFETILKRLEVLGDR